MAVTVSTPPRSLTRQTLLQMAILIAIIVALATVISYIHVSRSLRTQALDQLQQYIQQRGLRESAIFRLASDNLHVFARAYVKRFNESGEADPAARFTELFSAQEDGSVRLRERFFTGQNITGVINKQVDIDADLRKQLVIGYEMLAQYGPAWQNRFVNLYLAPSENAILMFWPGQPWGLNANSWEVYAKLALNPPVENMVRVIDENQPLEGDESWSDLYFDYAVNDWMISTLEPIQNDGQHVIVAGLDILLRELIERTIHDCLEGTYNLIFRADGLLLAHPRFMDAIQAKNGTLTIAEAGDANLLRIFNLVKQGSGGIIDNRADNEYLAATRLEGPGWYLVTVYPKAIIAKQAFTTARLILLLGALALLLEIIISFAVLRKQIAKPLTSLMDATNRIAGGDFNVQVDERRPDEIGRLARSFNTMSRELGAREAALSERSAKLALLNRQLERELEERERAEREIAQQRDALHQSEKLSALGSLLAGVAHELNNPLSVVVGRTIMLESELDDPESKARLGKIRVAAERCARIVKTFLAIARQQPPQHKAVQLNALIEAAVELISYSLRTADIETVLDLDPTLPEVSADADQLTQVFTNLIINAQQALLDVPVPRRLTIVSRQDGAGARIEFTDNGPGVPEAMRSRIFEPFYTSKPIGVGTGIGLSFSHGVLTAHGGEITLESPAQGGARFVVTLPLAAPVKPEAATAEASEAGGGPQAILIVDDEPEVADLLSDLLAPEGHRIDVASSGNEALDRLSERPYAAILSDLKMPGLDGEGLYQRLKQAYPHLLQRLVFISGDTLGIGSNEFLANSGRPLLEKPFVPAEVIQVVRRVLQETG